MTSVTVIGERTCSVDAETSEAIFDVVSSGVSVVGGAARVDVTKVVDVAEVSTVLVISAWLVDGG